MYLPDTGNLDTADVASLRQIGLADGEMVHGG